MTISTNLHAVISCLRSGKLFLREEHKIQCDSVSAIPYRDLIECYLYLSRMKNWVWQDPNGGSAERQNVFEAAGKLVRDGIAWPWLYAQQAWQVTQLLKIGPTKKKARNNTSILFLRSDHWFNVKSGGSVGHLSGVIDGFKALGNQVHVVSTDQLVNVPVDSSFHLCRPVYNIGRNISNFPDFEYNHQLSLFINLHWKEWDPAFIYQRYSLGNYTGVLLKAQHNIPYVCEYNGSFTWIARKWGKGKLLHEGLINRIELLNLKTADLLVVVSQVMKDELAQRGIKPEKVLVNPNGVDPEYYSPVVDGSAVRRKYGLEEKIVIGFIGTFGKWHGAEVLTEAFGNYLQQNPEMRAHVRLLMIGDGDTMPLVLQKLAHYGIESASILTGLIPQDQGPKYLAACDILVSPHVPNADGTPFFGSPTKIFEYMAMGKAIIASNLDQIGEVLQHGQTAWLVQPNNVNALANGLHVLIEDEPLRCRLGMAARDEVVAHYSWLAHVGRTIKKLDELCQ